MKRERTRVMHVVPDLGVGGLTRVVESLCATADRNRFDVSVLSFRGGGEFVDVLRRAGVPVFILGDRGERPRADYAAFLKVARLARAERIDVLHTHNTQPFIDGVLGGMVAGVGTVVHTDHARNFPVPRRYVLAERMLSHFVYRVVGVSDNTSQNLVRHLGIAPGKVMTIPNGVDARLYDVRVDRQAKCRELGLPSDAVILGYASRLEAEKGVSYLLDAMPPIIEGFPQVVLVVAGQGREREALERQAQMLGIGPHVRFLGVRFDIPQLLQVFDVTVLPSVREGLPMIVLEAMAAGSPVVASAVGGVSMAVRHGETGVLVEPKSPAALAAAVAALLGDPDRRRRYAEAGRRAVRAEFTAEAMTRRYEALYLRQAPLSEARPSGR